MMITTTFASGLQRSLGGGQTKGVAQTGMTGRNEMRMSDRRYLGCHRLCLHLPDEWRDTRSRLVRPVQAQ